MRLSTLVHFFFFTMIAGLLMLSCPVRGQDVPVAALADTTVVYTNVDLVIEYDWTEGEQVDAVDAHLIYLDNQLQVIEIYRDFRKISYYHLREGMTIKIYSHAGRKLLRVLAGSKPVVL